MAVDPVIGCVARGIRPLCPQCTAGVPSACYNSISKAVIPGLMLGFTYGLGGGLDLRLLGPALATATTGADPAWSRILLGILALTMVALFLGMRYGEAIVRAAPGIVS